jgi:geranylgeranyl pyrophosphate synthase
VIEPPDAVAYRCNDLEMRMAKHRAHLARGEVLAQSGDVDVAAVTQLQGLKTGALFGWCVEACAIMGRLLRQYPRCAAHALPSALRPAD